MTNAIGGARAALSLVVPVTPSAAGAGVDVAGDTDGLAVMVGALTHLRDAEVSLAKIGVGQDDRQRVKALADLQDALKRAAASDPDAGSGFFASLGKIVDDVADDVFHGRFADAWSDFGGDVAAAWESPKFWSDLETGFRDIATVSGALADAAGQVGGEAGSAVAAAATTVASWATAGAQLCQARGEGLRADGQDADADAVRARGSMDALTRHTTFITDDARANLESNAAALRTVDATLQQHQKTQIDTLTPSLRG